MHRTLHICLLILLATSHRSIAQATRAGVEHQFGGGRVRLHAPSKWHLIEVTDTGATPHIIFHVRNPATDTGSARTNVIVEISTVSDRAIMRRLTDSIFTSMYDGYAILGDTMPGPDRRFYFWAGREGGTPYTIYDDFARRGTTFLRVRIALPLKPQSSSEWSNALAGDSEALLTSLRLDGVVVFPGWAAHPTISVWSKSGPSR